MELRQLRYFKAVAELLNFSRAAEQLHVAQSALSRQIQALEHDVGTKLLDRDRSRVSLTDAGQAFHASVGKLLLQVDIAVTEAQQIARGASGRLVVCTDWRLDAHIVSVAVDEFRRMHPRVEIALQGTAPKEQIALIRSGQAHLGFIAREFIGKKSELHFLSIQRVYVNAILPSRHRFARRSTVRLADLAKETWVKSDEKDAAPFTAYFIQQCRLSGFKPRIGMTAENLDALFGYVASGYGITAAPDHLRPRHGLALCCVRTDCPPIEFGAFWRSSNQSPLLEHFLNLLRQQVTTAQPPAAG
ncbi:MAG TPA: LysR family transcriptional regulator [Lacunisphaera sp.]|nr:LysR family transcriptional regulator [Lacunisphaera sp.]